MMVSYNLLLMQRMGNIDNAVPFFGKGFNKLYPLIMVVYTILVASSFFHRIINTVGNWKRFAFQDESDDLDGVDPSGLVILQKGKYYKYKIWFTCITFVCPCVH